MVQDPRVSHQLARLGGVYRDPSRVDRDASTLLKSSVGVHLQPIISMYADPSATQGSTSASQTVLVLQGTIAIHFRGNTYQLLVDIYLLSGYPIRPPVCYVRLADPTMYLKPNHKHVGSDGKVYLPYLHEWAASTHNLVELVVAMSSVFSADPPVFSRPAAAQPTPPPPPPPSSIATALPVVASLPTGYRTAISTAATTVTGTPISSSFYKNSNGISTATMTATGTNGIIRNGTNTISSTYLSQQQQLEAMLAQEAAEANAAAEVARQAEDNERQKVEALRLEKQWEQAKIVELRTKLQAKVRQYCYDQSMYIKRDVQQDYRDSEMLQLSTTNKVQYQLDQYKQLKNKLEQQIKTTNQRTKDIEIWLEENQNYIRDKLTNGDSVHTSNNKINVDTAVALSNTLEQQMLDLSSENSALQDVLYYLDRALYNGDIDCPTHLKHVRNIAKQQFYIRALFLKVQQSHHTNTLSGSANNTSRQQYQYHH